MHGGVILDNLLFTPATYHKGSDHIGRRGKLQSGGPEIDSMVTRNLTQPLARFDERRRNLIRVLSVVISWAAREGCQQESATQVGFAGILKAVRSGDVRWLEARRKLG
jgi:hypothetical protein